MAENRQYKLLNNNLAEALYADRALITADGIMFAASRRSGITTYGISLQDGESVIGRIFVDVNGQKGPNKFGIDTFIFYITNIRGIIPAGNSSHASCNKSSSGYTCAGRVLKEGAINY